MRALISINKYKIQLLILGNHLKINKFVQFIYKNLVFISKLTKNWFWNLVKKWLTAWVDLHFFFVNFE